MTENSNELWALVERHDREMRLALDENRGADACDIYRKYLGLVGRSKVSRASLYRRSLLRPADYEAELPYVAEARNVLLESGYWMLFAGEGVYADETMQRHIYNHPWVQTRGTADREQFVFELPLAAASIDMPCVLLGGDDNYAHWTIRCLARLWLLRERADLAAFPVLTRKTLTPTQGEMLDRLGIGLRVKLDDAGLYRCRELHVPVCPRGRPWLKAALRWLRERLLESGADRRPGFRRLYVSRSDARWRRMLNEEAVWAELEPMGFERVVLGNLPFGEQMALFTAAEIVVGAHGAGLTNILFCPPETRILEISDPYMSHISDFAQIAAAIGHRYERFVSTDVVEPPPEGAHFAYRYHDFRAEPRAVRTALERLMLA